MRKNKEAAILEKTYHDRLTVTRKRMVVDPETLESVETDYIVYDNITCAYSQSGNNTPERQEFYSEKKMDSVIFTLPGVFLQDNDIAVVTTEAGQVFKGKTGHTFGYISHGETPFSVEETA